MCVVIFWGCCDCDKTKQSKPVVVGKMSWSDWQKVANWNDYKVDAYSPDADKVEYLRQIIAGRGDIKFKIFAGTWCYDSEVGVPKIYKLFSLIGIDESNIELYGVNRQKVEPTGEAEKYGIERVPTLVILLGDLEVSRIVEYPKQDWETDLLEILSVKK